MTKSNSASQHAAAPEPAERPPRREVVEETHETLDVMRLERTPRDEKLALEQARLEDAAEVHFTERGVALRDTDVESVRARIDALQLPDEKRPLPEARPPPPPPPQEAELDLEEVAPEAELTAQERAALEKKVGVKLTRVDTLYRTAVGHAVEVTFEKGGRTHRAPYILREGEAADLDELGRVLDQMPLPAAPPAPPVEPDAPEATEAPAAPEVPQVADAPEAAPAAKEAPSETPAKAGKPKKKGLFGRKKDKVETPDADATPAAPAAEAEPPAGDAPAEPAKKRFGFGKRSKTAVASEADAEPAPTDGAAAASDDAKPSRKKGLFGRKKAEAPDAQKDADATGEEAQAGDKKDAKKKRFGLRRK